MFEVLGWLATFAFALSYLFKSPSTLRLVQTGAALLWIAYGVMIGAIPVVVSNLAVAVMAGYLLWRQGRGPSPGPVSEAGTDPA